MRVSECVSECVCVNGKRAEGSIKRLVRGRKINKVLPTGNPVRLGRATESKRTEQWRLGPGPHLGAEPGAWLGQPAPQGPADGHYLGTRNTRNTAQGGHSFGRARVLCRQLLDRQAGDGRGSQGRIRPCVWAPRAQSRAKRIKGRAERPAGAQQFASAMGAGRVQAGRGQSPRGRGMAAGSGEGEGAGRRPAKGSPPPAPGRLHSHRRCLHSHSASGPPARQDVGTLAPCVLMLYRCPAGFQPFPAAVFYRGQHRSPVTAPLRFESLGSIVFLVARYCAIPDSHMNPERLVQPVSLSTVKGIAANLPKRALGRDTRQVSDSTVRGEKNKEPLTETERCHPDVLRVYRIRENTPGRTNSNASCSSRDTTRPNLRASGRVQRSEQAGHVTQRRGACGGLSPPGLGPASSGVTEEPPSLGAPIQEGAGAAQNCGDDPPGKRRCRRPSLFPPVLSTDHGAQDDSRAHRPGW